MRTTADYLRLLQSYKTAVADKYGIRRIGIFGSVARGEQTVNSDIDIVVDLVKPRLFLARIKTDAIIQQLNKGIL